MGSSRARGGKEGWPIISSDADKEIKRSMAKSRTSSSPATPGFQEDGVDRSETCGIRPKQGATFFWAVGNTF